MKTNHQGGFGFWWAMLAAMLLAGLVGRSEAQAGEMSEESLIAAWEAVQKNDPKTEVFERVEPGVYQFRTSRFPYDGALRVVGMTIDETSMVGEDGWAMGIVEVELADLPDDFFMKHSRSYGVWEQGNILYFDPKAGAWMTPKQMQEQVSERAGGGACWLSWSGYFWVGILVVAIVFLVAVSRKANKQMNKAMSAQDRVLADHQRVIELSERAVQLSEDSNRVLKEILEVMKERG